MRAVIFLIVCYFGVQSHCFLEESFIEEHFIEEPFIEENKPIKKDIELLKLLNTSLQNEGDYKLANEIFKKKFGQKLVEISYVSEENSKFLSHSNTLYIDHDLAEDFLKAFGASIEKVAIAYRFIPSFKQKKIGELVNIYSYENLLEFHAKFCKEWVKGVFDDMRKPFKNVERVTFDGEWKNLNESSMGFGDLFPKMRVLNLSYDEGYIFDHHYPHLMELHTDKLTSSGFTTLIKKNPQIRKLKIEDTTVEFLENLNEKLPNLEEFAFNIPNEFRQYNGSQIYFENVKEVVIKDKFDSFRADKLSFKQLNLFTLSANNLIDDEWIEFIGDNKNLNKLVISSGHLNDTKLLKLSNKIDSLTEAKIRFNVYTHATTIAQFIRNNKHMGTVTLTRTYESEEFFKRLIEILKNEWNIVPSNGRYSKIRATKLASTTVPIKHNTYIEDLTEIDDQTEAEIGEQNVSLSEENSAENNEQTIAENNTQNITEPSVAEHSAPNAIETTTDNGASAIYDMSLAMALLVFILIFS